MASLQIISVCYGTKSVEFNYTTDFLAKKIPNLKKNRPNRSSDEGDIANLKLSCVADIFQGNEFVDQTCIFWCKICRI